MKERTKALIEDLLVDERAKRSLYEQDVILNNEKLKNKAPLTLLISDSGCGVTSYSRVLAQIVDESHRIPENNAFIDVIFPKDNEVAEMLMYASPKRVANSMNFKNTFNGTMVISLSEFRGRDLLESESFDRLIKFIDSNKSIHFVIHILPGFQGKEELIRRIGSVVNHTEVELTKPGVDESAEYFETELSVYKVQIDSKAKKYMKMIFQHVDGGYRSIEMLIEKVLMKLAITDTHVISEDLIKQIIDEYKENNSKSEHIPIGFVK